MGDSYSLNILCIATYRKGDDFLRECKRQGCRVYLVTVESLAQSDWPREAIDELFFLPNEPKPEDIIHGVSYLARERRIDRIVPLDDFDVEKAALLREHMRLPGMGESVTRYFRDKLAMRVRAQEGGILVPDFVSVFNYDRLREYMQRLPPPYVLKPRSEASAIGIKKIEQPEALWPVLEELGDKQSYYVLEKYIPGDVYHVDAITSEGQVVFAVTSKYGRPPMNVAHDGGVFITRNLPAESAEAQTLARLNQELLSALSFVRGVSHTEFIQGRDDGQFYFLETAARVGGANIVELVEAATGINLWAEWAKLEIAQGERPYHLPEYRNDYAGILISLAKQEQPDTSGYNDPEVVWRLTKKHHAGLIVASPDPQRIEHLLDQYSQRFYQDFFTSLPLPDKPWS